MARKERINMPGAVYHETLRGNDHAHGFPSTGVNGEVVHKIEVIVPSNKSQTLFGDYVLPMLTQVRQLGIYNDKLRAARDLLLPKLMSGEIHV